MRETKLVLSSLLWRGSEWLERPTRVVVDLREIVQSAVAGGKTSDPLYFNMHLSFRSKQSDCYRYFPFIFQCIGRAGGAEIGEVDAEHAASTIELRRLPLGGDGTLAFDFEMEYVAEDEPTPGDPEPGLELTEIRCIFLGADAGGGTRRQARSPRLDSCAAQSGQPVFVVGSGRSGTSILSWALGQHPNIGALEETNWLPLTLLGAAGAHALSARPKRNAPRIYGIDRSHYLQQIGAALDGLHRDIIAATARRVTLQRLSQKAGRFNADFQISRSEWSPKRRWVDGAPINVNYMPLLGEAFPQAKFIATVREPVATIKSYVNFAKAGGPAVTIEEAASYWVFAMRRIIDFASVDPDALLILDYEDFVRRPREALRNCFEFLDEPNFERATDTLGTKINSSYPAGETVEAVDASHPAVAACIRIHDDWKSRRPCAEPMLTQIYDYADWENDVVGRIVKCVS